MRGDYKSRMDAYAIGVGNGFFSPNDVRRLENMDLIPADEGGDDYYLNGSYTKLKAAGAPIVITAPAEGTGYELASMSLVKGGKDTVNAKKLYDWILSSPVAQQTFTEWYVVLVADGAPKHPDALSINEIKTVVQDMAWDGDSVNKTRLLDRWTNEIGNKR